MALESQKEQPFQKHLTLNSQSANVEKLESIRGEKGVEENLPFACVLSASTITIIFISTAVSITLSLLTPSPEESRLSRFFRGSFSSQQSNKHMRGI